MPSIKLIHAHFLVPTGDYSSERVGFTAELADNETVKEAVDKLRRLASESIGVDAETLYDQRKEATNCLFELQTQIKKAKKEWDAIREFLIAQGLRPDAPNFPEFENLLPSKILETVTAETIDSEDVY